jgi:hypothetical protein
MLRASCGTIVGTRRDIARIGTAGRKARIPARLGKSALLSRWQEMDFARTDHFDENCLENVT